MPQTLLCPMCGRTVPADAPGEVCPACLMQLGLGLDVRDTNGEPPPSSAPRAQMETLEARSDPSIREKSDPASDPICIPGYEFLGELGRGGMGVVYKARDLDLKRLVALKMIVAAFASPDQIERFRREAEAVARLTHPNIVQIYEVGQREDRPYFSLEFVDGGNLADKLRGTPLPPAVAARVVETLARAVHAAHERGIIHRDLKPANVLLTADGTPKIADFGLAKQTDSNSSQTQEGTVFGTPSYMAPEQASGATKSIGPAADTYALGAILYETLTGRPPFKGVTTLDTLLQVVSLEPARPSDLQPHVPRDLETICLLCLHKDPARRYASAQALAEDLHRFQAGEPILARPIGLPERLMKWSRRHPMSAGLAAALLIMVGTAFGLLLWKLQETDALARESERAAKLDREGKEKADELTEEANKRAEAENRLKEQAKQQQEIDHKRTEELARALEKSEQISFTAQIWRAAGLIDSDPGKALQILQDKVLCPPQRRDFTWGYQYQLGQRMVKRMAQQEEGIERADISSDGKLLATAPNDKNKDKRVRLWDLVSGEAGVLLQPGHGGDTQLAFSPDGKILATGGGDGLVKLYSMPTGKLMTTLKWQNPGGKRQVYALAFDPTGKKLAVGGAFFDEMWKKKHSDWRYRYFVLWVWDLPSETGRLLRSHHGQDKDFYHENTGVNALAYSPDGKTLAVGLTSAASVLMLDADTGELRQRHKSDGGFIGGMGFSNDGKLFAYGDTTSNVFVVDMAASKIRHKLYGHLGYVRACAFTEEGALVTGSTDGTMRVWDPWSGQLRTVFRCGGVIWRIGVPPQSKQAIAATSSDAQVWSLRALAPAVTLTFQRAIRGATMSTVAFDEVQPRFAVVGPDDRVLLYKVTRQVYVAPKEKKLTAEADSWFASVSAKLDGELKGFHEGKTTAVAFGPANSDMIVSGGEDCQILVWRGRGGGKQDPPKILSGHTGPVTHLAVSRDGTAIVSASNDGTVRLWDVVSGESSQPFCDDKIPVTALALTRDGKRLVTGDKAGRLRIWDFPKRVLLQSLLKAGPGPIDQMSVTPDGKWAATISGQTVAVHDLTANTTRTYRVSGKRIALTPDGKTFAVPGADRVLRLYDVVSGHLRCELPVLSHHVFGLGFNSDATLLTTVSHGDAYWDATGEIKLWPATPAETK